MEFLLENSPKFNIAYLREQLAKIIVSKEMMTLPENELSKLSELCFKTGELHPQMPSEGS